jgi:hypothetical protein
MAGARIPDEDTYERDGMTAPQRDRLIMSLRRKGYSQAKIAARLHMTQPGVKYAIDRISGKARRPSVPMDMCEGCWADKPRNQLNVDGLCEACAE